MTSTEAQGRSVVPEKEGPAARRPSSDQGASLGLRASVSITVRTQQRRRLYHQPREPFSEKGRCQYSSIANLKIKEARIRGFGPLLQLAQVTSTEERSPDRGHSHRAIGPGGRGCVTVQRQTDRQTDRQTEGKPLNRHRPCGILS